ncbi:MAG: sulfotransferase domain-containing protein [Actinomycetota bacterium]
MIIEAPTADFVTVVEDSRRWREIDLREDDIIVSTPPKSGTTWTQGMLLSMLWPDGDPPGTLGELSRWVDNRVHPIEEVRAALAGQQHRRVIKTHSPGDTTPFSPELSYVTVYRDPADALVSWGNHRAAMRPAVMEAMNELAAADGLDPLPLQFGGDYDVLYEEWAAYCSPARHLAGWWHRRHEPNVLMLHYAGLSSDLQFDMRRLAAFAGIEVPDGDWPAVVDRCRIDAMRETARSTWDMDGRFEGGADAFFNTGGNGRGAQLLRDEQLHRIRSHCADLLPPDAVAWLYDGGPLPA